MRCISIASGKGGVGKSIVCANLAVALADAGYSVAVIDADIEGPTLSLLFGYRLEDDATLHDYLSESAAEDEVVRKVSQGVSAVFGSVQLTALMRELKLERLKKLASWIKERHDFVLIDTPPGFDEDAFAAIDAGDGIIIVLNPDILSVTGALKVRGVAKRLGKQILGFVINRAGHEYDIPVEEMEAVIEEEVLAVIEDDRLIRNSVLEGIPLVESHPEAPASRGIKELSKRLIQNKSPV